MSEQMVEKHNNATMAGPPAFDFQNSTLNLLHQQELASKQFHQPQQQHQYVQNILHPTQFSDAKQSESQQPTPQPQQAAQHARTSSNNSTMQIAQAVVGSVPYAPSFDPNVHHSSFLIQDRIHFFERYAVQPAIGRRDQASMPSMNDSKGMASYLGFDSFQLPVSSENRKPSIPKQSAHVNDQVFTRSIVAHTRHAGAGPDDGLDSQRYGSTLGQPFGAYTDRGVHSGSSGKGLSKEGKKAFSKTLSGSGAPQVILQNPMTSTATKARKALIASHSSTTTLGFGSSAIKDAASTITATADQRKKDNAANPNAGESSSPRPSDDTAHSGNAALSSPAFLGKSPRFQGTSPTRVAQPSASHAQWGQGASANLPAFLDGSTARNMESERKRLRALQAAQSLSTGPDGKQLDAEGELDDEYGTYGLNNTRPIANGLGGYIIDNGDYSSRRTGYLNNTTAVHGVNNLDISAFNIFAQGSAKHAKKNGTISMAEHCRMVNEALSAKTAELLAIYKHKIANEAAMIERDYYFSHSQERLDLQRIISNYQEKLTEISTQFSSLSSIQTRIHALKLNNASLRVFNLELARNYDAELNDMKLEIQLLQEQNASPLQQIHSLEKHIQQKKEEKKQLRKEIKVLQNQIETQKPLLEKELNETYDKFHGLTKEISEFNQKKSMDFMDQASQISNLQAQIGEKLKSNITLQNKVDTLRKNTATIRVKLSSAEQELKAQRKAYQDEVQRGVGELDNLQQSLHDKSKAFDEHYLLLQHLIGLAMSMDDKLKFDLLCRSCMQLFTNPVLLWPCGHTLCEKCVTKTEADGTPLKPVDTSSNAAVTTASVLHSKSLSSLLVRSDSKKALPPSSSHSKLSVNTNTGGGSQVFNPLTHILICTECKYNYDHPVSKGEGSDEDDISFPNPYFDPPANFTGRFYMVPNVMIAKLVDAYKKCSKQIEELRPEFQKMSKSVDVFRTYLADSNIASPAHRLASTGALIDFPDIIVQGEEESNSRASSAVGSRSASRSETRASSTAGSRSVSRPMSATSSTSAL